MSTTGLLLIILLTVIVACLTIIILMVMRELFKAFFGPRKKRGPKNH